MSFNFYSILFAMFRPLFMHWLRFYRWLRYRHGFGVHSPYAFALINDVVEEKYLYYAYYEVYHQLNRLCVYCFRGDRKRQEYYRFLFRLSNFRKPGHILCVGSDGGADLLFLMASSNKTACTLIDFIPKNIDSAFRLCEDNNRFSLIESEDDTFLAELEVLLKSKSNFQLIVIHRSLSPEGKQKAVELCLLYQKEDCLVVMDDLLLNDINNQCWNMILSNPNVTISFDLIHCGIFCFNNKLSKKNYKYYM